MARLRRNAPRPSLSPEHPEHPEQGRLAASTIHRTQGDVLNTTFSLHRASPLYIGPHGLSTSRLTLLGQQLRDALVGDIVRGVEISLDGGNDRAMGNAGVLEEVTIEWVAADAFLGPSTLALQVALRYENALCSALLLPGRQATVVNPAETGAAADQPFMHFPLLLLRMPTPLKAVVIEFFTATFDCQISPLHLHGRDLVRSWETWARDTGVPTAGPLAKDAVLTLGFHLSGPLQTAGNAEPGEVATSTEPMALGLKTADILIPKNEVSRFLGAGKRLGLDECSIEDAPFTSSLARYVEHHLALDMTNPAVGIVRIACGGFVLSENRMKIFGIADSSSGVQRARHEAAIRQFLEDLIARSEVLS